MYDQTKQNKRRSHSRKLFWRGLTILLPSILTIWILITGYQFVQQRIAEPINTGIRAGIAQWSPLPVVLEEDLINIKRELTQAQHERMRQASDPQNWLRQHAKTVKIHNLWTQYSFPLDLLGLIVAIFLICVVGLLLGSYIGHSLYRKGEKILQRLPLFKQVYPSVKQITDFLVTDGEERLKYSRVVAVQYPRKGIWAVGLITGETMINIEKMAGVPCATVFIPSSPTPFTGYTISVPRTDLTELPITVEEALRFTVSGGVVLPPSQSKELPPQGLSADRTSKVGTSNSSDVSPDSDSSTLAKSQT